MQTPDEKRLFSGSPKAAKLHADAKKLAREHQRREFWAKNKPKESHHARPKD